MPGDDLKRNLIFRGRDNDKWNALEGRLNCGRSRVLAQLEAAADQGLHVERSGADKQNFQIDTVFFRQARLAIYPKRKLVAARPAVTGAYRDRLSAGYGN